MQIIAELSATVSREPIGEDMDTTTDYFIIQQCIPDTSDAVAQVPVIKKTSVHVSVYGRKAMTKVKLAMTTD